MRERKGGREGEGGKGRERGGEGEGQSNHSINVFLRTDQHIDSGKKFPD